MNQQKILAYDGAGNSMYLTPEEYEQFLGGFGKAIGKAASFVADRAGGIAQTGLGVITGNIGTIGKGLANTIGIGGSKAQVSTPVTSVSGVPVAPSAAQMQLEMLQSQIVAQQKADAAEKEAQRKADAKSKDNLLLYGGIGAGGLILVLILVFAIK